MITIIIYDSISFIKLPMNDSKEITLFVDNYNSNHSDAVLLVANYLSKDKNLSAEIIISKNKQLNLKTINKNKKEDYLVLDLDLNSKKLDFKTYFIGLIYQAREKLGSGFPKTKIEKDIEKSLHSLSFYSEVNETKFISKNIKEISFIGDFRKLETQNNDEFLFVIVPLDKRKTFLDKEYSMEDYRKQMSEEKKITAGAYYTIRNFSEDEIKMWFVLHSHSGNLGNWAEKAKTGDQAILWGPRSMFSPSKRFDHLILLADETGIPAMKTICENNKNFNKCTTFYEVIDKSFRIPTSKKNKILENWIHREDDEPGEGDKLLESLRAYELPEDNFYIFGAGEARQMMKIRKLFKEKGVSKDQMHITGYWKK